VISDDPILIVEDSDAKLASIISALQRILPGHTIDYAKSVKSAIVKIRKHAHSLIIADMSLPTFDVKDRERGGTARPFGGIEIFDYLQQLRRSTPVIVVSSYPAIVDGGTTLTLNDLSLKLSVSYAEIFAGYVFFDSAYLSWETELKSFILEINDGRRGTN
jgi:CheY-like chemotaxis protein